MTVNGQSSTRGITNTGKVETSTLNVTGQTTTTGIDNQGAGLTNTGDINTDGGNIDTGSGNLTVGGITTLDGDTSVGGTLSVDGQSTLKGNTSVGGTLTVNGQTTTNGITNHGNIQTTSLNVTGQTTLEDGLTVQDGSGNDILTVDSTSGNTSTKGGNFDTEGGDIDTGSGSLTVGGTTTLNGNASVGGTLSVNGQTTTNGITNNGNIQTTSLNVTDQTTTNGINNNGGGITNAGNIGTNGGNINTSGGDIDTGGGNVNAKNVKATGTVQGQRVTATDSFSVDNGATIKMGMNRVQGVADPLAPTDTANKRYVDQQINKAFNEIDKNSEGIALSMAMSGLILPSNANFAIGAQFGFFDDEQAIAAQGAVRLDENFTLIGGVGVGLGDESPAGGRIGVQASF